MDTYRYLLHLRHLWAFRPATIWVLAALANASRRQSDLHAIAPFSPNNPHNLGYISSMSIRVRAIPVTHNVNCDMWAVQCCTTCYAYSQVPVEVEVPSRSEGEDG